MEQNSHLFYSPPVRGKIGSLHSGSYLCFDALFILFFFFLPEAALDTAQRFLSSSLKKKLFAARGVNDRDVLFVDSGTSALALALEIIGVKKGEEVYFSSNTCGAVCNAVLASGGIPVFLGVRDDGLTDIESLSRIIDIKRGRALILTNTYGLLEDVEYAQQQAKKFNLFIINDLAQVNVVSNDFIKVCTQADISVLSFGPEKYFVGLGAGALVYKSSLNVQFKRPEMELQTNIEVIKLFWSRIKYYLTFYVFGSWFYRPLLKIGMVFKLRKEKDIENIETRTIEPKFANPIILLGIYLRAYFFGRRRQKELRRYSLFRNNVDPCILVGTSSEDYVPPCLTIRTSVTQRFSLAKIFNYGD